VGRTKRKILAIYGAGGMGREIAALAQSIDCWRQIFFVDDDSGLKEVNGRPVYTLETLTALYAREEFEFIVSVGEPSLREALYGKLGSYRLKLTRLFAPGFSLSPFTAIGEGTVIHTGALVTCNVSIGEGSLINKRAVIGHDVKIGRYSVLSPLVAIGGGAKIGERCFLGSGALIKNGIRVGADSVIGMGAVVLKDVERNAVMVGNPARLLRKTP
jgi:sugar O-acyltransferase (sialic acid O-acetyltransferase NeuD family)